MKPTLDPNDNFKASKEMVIQEQNDIKYVQAFGPN